MKESHLSSPDRFNLLTEYLLEDILTRVPLQEAVRTSVLSNRWRYIWTRMPNLQLDELFCKREIREDRNMLVSAILHFLSLHQGPILRFSFSLPELVGPVLDQIIDFVSTRGVKHFHLNLGSQDLVYKLAASFFSCVQVEDLKLESCKWDPPLWFVGFGKLTSMHFCNVEVDGGEFSDLVSDCPLLETLTLDNLPFCTYIDLVAPNLKSFKCRGFFLCVNFKYTPKLETVSIHLDDTWIDELEEGEEEEEMLVCYDALHAVKYVELNGCFLKHMNWRTVGKNVQNNMIHLAIIKLYDVSYGQIYQALNILSLIRSSPNLEKLTVSACIEQTIAMDSTIGAWKDEHLSNFSLNKLREVEITNITGKVSEMLFANKIRAKSPMLERMVLKWFLF